MIEKPEKSCIVISNMSHHTMELRLKTRLLYQQFSKLSKRLFSFFMRRIRSVNMAAVQTEEKEKACPQTV